MDQRVQFMRQELEKLQVTSEMQEAEIKRLNELTQPSSGDPNMAVSKANVVRLMEKVEQLRIAFLEKERELQVLLNQSQISEDSYRLQFKAL